MSVCDLQHSHAAICSLRVCVKAAETTGERSGRDEDEAMMLRLMATSTTLWWVQRNQRESSELE